MIRTQKSASVLRIPAIAAALALAALAPGCSNRSQETAPNGPSIAPEGQSTLGAQPSPPAQANPTPANQPQPTPGSAAQPTPTSAAQPTPPPSSAAQPTPTPGAPRPSSTSASGPTAPPSGGCDPGKEPNRVYNFRDPNQCKVALFRCPADKKAFFNNCGCGCE